MTPSDHDPEVVRRLVGDVTEDRAGDARKRLAAAERRFIRARNIYRLELGILRNTDYDDQETIRRIYTERTAPAAEAMGKAYDALEAARDAARQAGVPYTRPLE